MSDKHLCQHAKWKDQCPICKSIHSDNPKPTTKHDELVEEVAELLQRFGLGGGNNPSEEARGIIALIRRDERQRCVEAVESEFRNTPLAAMQVTSQEWRIIKAIKELEL